jgi:hypothetical protein
MRARTAAIIVGAADCIAAAAIAFAFFGSGSDPATKGFDVAGGWVVILLLLVTGAPGLALALARRAPNTALALVLGFPVGFILVFIAVVIAFTFFVP